MSNRIKCLICGAEHHHLAQHLQEKHQLSVAEYLKEYSNAEVSSKALLDKYKAKRGGGRRCHPPKVGELKVGFAGLKLPINLDVPEDDCLVLPECYQAPKHGKLGEKVHAATIAIASGMHLYIHGTPGTGKDAAIHAYCAKTRTPSALFQVRPETDIESWFFTQGISKDGDYWREGKLLKMLRDGYTTTNGRTIPYLILISDFDRADRAQAEALRLVMDSIQGRVMGPEGKVFKVFPGTIITATANSAGTGDERGMCISSNPIDSSILDRFQAGVQFHPMDWRDERKICAAKYPGLDRKFPTLLDMIGAATKSIRGEIDNGRISAEFSHRGVCNWLTSCRAIDRFSASTPRDLVMQAAYMGFIDKLPDEATREAVIRSMDAHIKGGALPEGDTSHIKTSSKGW